MMDGPADGMMDILEAGSGEGKEAEMRGKSGWSGDGRREAGEGGAKREDRRRL